MKIRKERRVRTQVPTTLEHVVLILNIPLDIAQYMVHVPTPMHVCHSQPPAVPLRLVGFKPTLRTVGRR